MKKPIQWQPNALKEWNLNLVDNLPQGFALHEIICDETGNPVNYRFLYINKSFEQMTGLQAETIIGRTVLDVLPGIEPSWIERYGRVALTGESERFEDYSAELNQHYGVYAFSPETGKFAVFVENTTGRHVMLEPLLEDRSLHRSLFETQQTIMLIVDPIDGSIIDANPSAAAFYGWSREVLRTMKVSQINTLSQEEILQEIRQAQSEQRAHFYFSHRLSDGRVCDVHVYSTPIVWEGKSYLCSMVYDISDRQRIDSLLEKLLAESRQQTREIEMLLHSARLVMRTRNFRSEARQLFDNAKQLTGATCGYISLLGEDGTESETLVVDSGDLVCDVSANVVDSAHNLRVQVCRDGRSVIENSFSDDGHVAKLPQGHPQLTNLLLVPLRIEENVVGLLGLANKPTAFTPRDLELSEALAELLSIAFWHNQTLEELRESSGYLSNLINYANAPIIVWNPRLQIMRFNRAFEEMTGYTAEAVIGRSLEMLFPDQTRQQSLQLIEQSRAGRYWDTVEIPIQRKDGEIRLALWNSANIYESDGETLSSVIAQGQDITDRKKAEESLRESESRYRAVIDQAYEAIILIDLETGMVIEGNAKFAEQFGYDLRQEGSFHITELAVDEPQNIIQMLKQAELDGALPPERRTLRNRRGAHVPVVRIGTVVQYQGRKVFAATLRDISADIRREQEVLRDASAAQSIQEALLSPLQSSEHLEMMAMYQPHLYVGGDLYFIDWRFEKKVLRGFLIDAMGHGLGTALHAAALHVILREINEMDLSLTAQMRLLNQRAVRHFAEDTLAAAIAFEVDLENHELRWVAAGVSDFWAATQASTGMMSSPGSYLGIHTDETFELHILPLVAGDMVYFCTDGMGDLLRGQREVPLHDWNLMRQFLSTLSQAPECRDDVTVLGLRVISFPDATLNQEGWPKKVQIDSLGHYQELQPRIAAIIAQVTGVPHSMQEVAINEALANALECRDGMARGHKVWIKFNRIGGRFIVRVKSTRMGFAGNVMLRRLRANKEDLFAFVEDAAMGRGIPMMLALSDRMTFNDDGTEVLLAWKISSV